MWISPNHPDPPRPQSPPEQDGQLLAALPRNGGKEELRVALRRYNDRPFVSLQLWARNDRNEMWPVAGRSVSVRLAEAAAVIEALRRATEPHAAAAHGCEQGVSVTATSPRDEPRFVDKGRRQRQPFDPGKLPRPGGGGDGFDEFEGG